MLAVFLLSITVIQPFKAGVQSYTGQIKNICWVDSSPALNGKFGVEIEIQSDQPFPAVNAMPVLQIGELSFTLSRYSESGRNIIIFTLTQQEFEKLRDGSFSLIKYNPDSQGTWTLGKLNKKMQAKKNSM